MRSLIRRVVKDEYRRERVFRYAFKVGYRTEFRSYAGFMEEIAALMLAGAMRGAEDMLARIYRSLMARSPLPPARRNPKRLKSW
jgi:hypothetical protein